MPIERSMWPVKVLAGNWITRVVLSPKVLDVALFATVLICIDWSLAIGAQHVNSSWRTLHLVERQPEDLFNLRSHVIPRVCWERERTELGRRQRAL
jgi:hypothetical protein